MRRASLLVFICLAGAALVPSKQPVFATGLEASWDVSVNAGVKTYAYTFYFSAIPGNPDAVVTEIDVLMPVSAAESVFDAATSLPGWGPSLLLSPEGASWRMGSGLYGSESVTMWLRTAADVPTRYDLPDGLTANWTYDLGGGGEGNSILPYPDPVPEPSSFLALACGLAGLVKLLRRRREDQMRRMLTPRT